MANRIILNPISFHGKGAIAEIVNIAKEKGFKHIFVCSDPDLVKFGVTAKVTDLLDGAGIAYTVYSGIKPNPTIENVKDGVAAFKACGADAIVTIGGGSSMDTAKAIGIIITNPEFGDVRSLEGVAPTKNHAVPTIAVPTTAGTAAEVTINYVITDVEKERKFVCVDEHDIPEYAVVDPDMMSSMPKGLTAATGMDALTHAIEGYTTKGAWEMTDMFHLEAVRRQMHDFKNHLRTIDGLVKGNEEAEKYIDELLQTSYAQARECRCGNSVIDAIINCKFAEARERGITMNYNISVDNPLPVAAVDLCAILSNQLDNAIEACEKTPEDRRQIDVEILQRNRLVYFKVVNDAPGDPFDEKRRLRTTKDDSDGLHGLGIANILDAARRNGGELKNEYKDGKFYSTAMISLEM